MPVSETEFKSWCYRNGGETYGEEERGRVACRFPDADVDDRVGYFSESGAFEVITERRFYSTRSLHQHAESRIDDGDRLLIDTDETRVSDRPSLKGILSLCSERRKKAPRVGQQFVPLFHACGKPAQRAQHASAFATDSTAA